MTEEVLAEYDGIEITKLTTQEAEDVIYCISGRKISTMHLHPDDWCRLVRAILMAEDTDQFTEHGSKKEVDG